MIDVQKHISSSVDSIYQSYYNFLEQDLGYNILLNYQGEFSVNLIRTFANGVEERMTQNGDKKYIIKRMFSILIEGLQNIYIHGGKDEMDRQQVFLIVAHNQSQYRVLMGNILDAEDRELVKAYLGNINNHSEEELKQLYLTVLKNGYMSDKGGAGLGIVTMRLKSSEDLNYKIYDLHEGKSFLVVEVGLDKS